jgi:ATP-dependent helicase/nuclease subunit B
MRDRQGAQRAAIEALVAGWQEKPPAHPVIVAGSTGSRGMTALLMQAVARLPQGALILPGFDFDMPADLWGALDDPLLSEDHPQYRYAALIRALALDPVEVAPWAEAAPDPARNRVISLALRPAPVTDRWLAEGARLGDLPAAMARAFADRGAGPAGRGAGHRADPARRRRRRPARHADHARPAAGAAGERRARPLADPPGRQRRAAAGPVRAGPVPAPERRAPAPRPRRPALVALLKNPIAHSAAARGPHLRHRATSNSGCGGKGCLFPPPPTSRSGPPTKRNVRAGRLADPGARGGRSGGAAAGRLGGAASCAGRGIAQETAPARASCGSASAGRPGAGADGRSRRRRARGRIGHGSDYVALLEGLLAGQSVRESVAAHPFVQILGTLEARVQGADLVILGGLNEGVWPQAPAPDPWFNRRMRLDAGLLLPERQVGLSAHDFQQAAGAAEVSSAAPGAMPRPRRCPRAGSTGCRTWSRGSPRSAARRRWRRCAPAVAHWLDLAARFDRDFRAVPPEAADRHPRPAPAPPVSARPRELPVTAIKHLIRDPYTIYAQHILRLRPLDPLTALPDARRRGIVLHRLFDAFTAAHPPGTPADPTGFLALAEALLAEDVPWPAARALWRARLARVAADFTEWNAALPGQPILAEKKGALPLSDPSFTLVGQPDRIDILPDGRLQIFDYKTGSAAEHQGAGGLRQAAHPAGDHGRGGRFPWPRPGEVERAEYVGVGTAFKCCDAIVTADALAEHRTRLRELLREYLSPDQGFTARRAAKLDKDRSDYDHLSRRGEWQVSDEARVVPVGDADG